MVVGCGESQGRRAGRQEGRQEGREGGRKEREKESSPRILFCPYGVIRGGGACFRYMNRIYVPALVLYLEPLRCAATATALHCNALGYLCSCWYSSTVSWVCMYGRYISSMG